MIDYFEIFVKTVETLFYTALVLAGMIAVMLIDIRRRIKAKEVS